MCVQYWHTGSYAISKIHRLIYLDSKNIWYHWRTKIGKFGEIYPRIFFGYIIIGYPGSSLFMTFLSLRSLEVSNGQLRTNLGNVL